MKKNIFLLTLIALVLMTGVQAQSTGFCSFNTNNQCSYFSFEQLQITVNEQQLTPAQEELFCTFIKGQYSTTQPENCENMYPNIIPEYSTIAAGVALTGASAIFMFLRKKETQ